MTLDNVINVTSQQAYSYLTNSMSTQTSPANVVILNDATMCNVQTNRNALVNNSKNDEVAYMCSTNERSPEPGRERAQN